MAKVLVISISTPLLIGIYENDKLVETIEMEGKTGVLFIGGVLADPGMAEEFVKAVCSVDIVIMIEDRAEQGFAKASWAEKNRIIDSLQFVQVLCLVDKVALFAYDGCVVGFTV